MMVYTTEKLTEMFTVYSLGVMEIVSIASVKPFNI